MFKKELKNNVKKKLMKYENQVNDLFFLMEASIELDNKLYELNLNKRQYNPRERSDIYENSIVNQQQKKSRFNKQSKFYYELILMKLNFTQQRKSKKFKNKQQNNKKNKKCYECDKLNHFARNCRFKGLISQRQINATLKKISEIENE